MTTDELEVPKAAAMAYNQQRPTVTADIRAIAAPVVAAHLRRLAGDMFLPADAAVLRAEADRLDGGAS